MWSDEAFALYCEALGRNQPGTTRGLEPPQQAGEPPLLAELALDDSLARVWTVTLAPLGEGARSGPLVRKLDAAGALFMDDNRAPQFVTDSLCVVEFGRAGATAFATVDWPSTGTSFTVPGSFVRVYGAVRSVDANSSNVNTTLRAFITPSGYPRPAYRTISYGNIAAAPATVERPVPAYAKRFVMLLQDGNVDTSLSQMNLDGNQAAGGAAANDPLWQTVAAISRGFSIGQGWWELRNGTNFISIENTGPAPKDNVSLLYECWMV